MLLVSVRVMAIFIEVIKLETNICYYEPPDWWGKMSVDWRCQPIMQELFFREHSWTEVNRLHHASCCHNTKQRVKVGFIRDISSIQRDREGFGTVDLKMHTLTAEKKKPRVCFVMYSPSFDQTIFHVTPRDLLHINRSFSSCPKPMFWKKACAKPSIRKRLFYSHPNISHFYRKVFEIVVSALSSYQIGKGSSPSVDILFSILSHNRLGLPSPQILHNLLFSELLGWLHIPKSI